MKDRNSPPQMQSTQRARRGKHSTTLRILRVTLRLCGELFPSYTQLRLVLLALVVSLSLSSCTASSTDQLKAALRTERSWAATLRLMAESWQRGAVTNAYMRKALEAVSEELRKEEESLKKQSGIAEEERAKLSERAGSLKQLATEMRRAVAQQDRAAVGQQLERLKGEEEAIRRNFAESLGEPVP